MYLAPRPSLALRTLFCSWMSNIHNFHLPPLLSIVFVQECSVALRKIWRGGTREAYIFVESLGKSLSSASKIEGGHYGFHVVLCRKYVVFWLSAFAHTSMKAGRGIYDRDDVSFTIARPARSKNWYKKARKWDRVNFSCNLHGSLRSWWYCKRTRNKVLTSKQRSREENRLLTWGKLRLVAFPLGKRIW